jgi:hypothetical protein
MRTSSLLGSRAIWSRLRERDISARDTGERDIGEWDIGEWDIRETDIRETDIGETVARWRLAQQLLLHIDIPDDYCCLSLFQS